MATESASFPASNTTHKMTDLRPSFLRRNLHHWVALTVLSLMTVAYTWPLVLQFTTHVIGVEKTDNYELLWLFRWVADAFVELRNPWFVPDIYAPHGYPIVYGEVTPLHSFLLMPFTVLAGEIVTYNVVTLLSTILTGWSVFALAHAWLGRLGGPNDRRLRFLAAFLAATAFTFSTYRIMKLQGQLNLFNTQFFVMGIAFWDNWLSFRRIRDAALTGLMLGLAALSTWYLGVMLGLCLVVYALVYNAHRQIFRVQGIQIGLVAFLVISGLICLPFVLPYFSLGSLPDVPLEEAIFWSASPTDYLLPNPLHPVWGGLTAKLAWPFPGTVPSEFTVPIGYVVALFALFGFRHTFGPRWRGLKWAVLVAFVISLGPVLHISRLPLGIPLPAMLLRELPVFGGLRTWIRFALIVQLGLSLLAGAGVYLALRRISSPRLRYAGTAALIALALFEAWPGTLGTIPVEPLPVDLWLADQSGDSAIMEYPLSVALSGPSLFYTDYHGRPITYAYGTFFETAYLESNPELESFPADAALDTLDGWGVQYVLVTLPALEGSEITLDDIRAQTRLIPVTIQGDVAVYELRPVPSF